MALLRVSPDRTCTCPCGIFGFQPFYPRLVALAHACAGTGTLCSDAALTYAFRVGELSRLWRTPAHACVGCQPPVPAVRCPVPSHAARSLPSSRRLAGAEPLPVLEAAGSHACVAWLCRPVGMPALGLRR